MSTEILRLKHKLDTLITDIDEGSRERLAGWAEIGRAHV